MQYLFPANPASSKLQKNLQKLEAACARGQDGDVVDFTRAKHDARLLLLHLTIEEVWQGFAAGVDADIAEKALQHLEAKLNEEVAWRICHPLSIAEMRAAQPAAHRAARGVRKIRGAK